MELSKIYAEQKEHMEKCIAALKRDFMTIRSGKVSTTILDNIHVDYYGTPTGLSQVATVLATRCNNDYDFSVGEKDAQRNRKSDYASKHRCQSK